MKAFETSFVTLAYSNKRIELLSGPEELFAQAACGAALEVGRLIYVPYNDIEGNQEWKRTYAIYVSMVDAFLKIQDDQTYVAKVP